MDLLIEKTAKVRSFLALVFNITVEFVPGRGIIKANWGRNGYIFDSDLYRKENLSYVDFQDRWRTF